MRIVVEAARDDGLVSFVTGLDAAEQVELAWDFRHESWDGVGGVVRVGDIDGRAVPLRPAARAAVLATTSCERCAESLRDPAYVYVRHEDEPTAPATAERLRALLQ